jgi:hypothetical protein
VVGERRWVGGRAVVASEVGAWWAATAYGHDGQRRREGAGADGATAWAGLCGVVCMCGPAGARYAV